MNSDISNGACDDLIRANRQSALSLDEVQQVLGRLAEALDVGPLQFDENGVVELSDDDGAPLSLHYGPGFAGVIVAAPVAASEQARGPLLRRILAANLSWSLTQGATFAMTMPDRQLVLCRPLALGDGDIGRIASELNWFIERVRQWRIEIELEADLAAAVAEPAIPVAENSDAFV